MKQKSKLSKFNKFLTVVLVIVLIANIVVIATKAVPTATVEEDTDDTAVIDEFVSATYGGVEFSSQEDVVNYYIDAYNKTKAQTQEYVLDSGETVTWYSFLGEEDLQVSNIMIEGKENATINKLVPGIVGGLFTKGACALSPTTSRLPADDNDEDGNSLTTSCLVADDILVANVTDNNDGTITLQLQPKQVNMSHKGADAQGHMFNTLGAIDSVVDSISVLSWASGTTAENCLVNYQGGYATVTIDTSTGLITTADYHMEAHISVTHANVTVIKDKSANLLVTYDVHYPASAEYLKENIAATAK
jgi:hypothetical protein